MGALSEEYSRRLRNEHEQRVVIAALTARLQQTMMGGSVRLTDKELREATERVVQVYRSETDSALMLSVLPTPPPLQADPAIAKAEDQARVERGMKAPPDTSWIRHEEVTKDYGRLAFDRAKAALALSALCAAAEGAHLIAWWAGAR